MVVKTIANPEKMMDMWGNPVTGTSGADTISLKELIRSFFTWRQVEHGLTRSQLLQAGKPASDMSHDDVLHTFNIAGAFRDAPDGTVDLYEDDFNWLRDALMRQGGNWIGGNAEVVLALMAEPKKAEAEAKKGGNDANPT